MSFYDSQKLHSISLFLKAFHLKKHILNTSIILMMIIPVIQEYDTVFSRSNHLNLMKYCTLLVGVKK